MLEDLPVWYSYGQIDFSYHQMRYFLLPNLTVLREGEYPTEPAEYQQFQGTTWYKFQRAPALKDKRKKNTTSPHERACLIVAEIDIRLKNIGTHRLLVDNILIPVSGALVTDAFTENLPLNSTLLEEAHRMLNYICGWKRKTIPYSLWLSGMERRENERNI